MTDRIKVPVYHDFDWSKIEGVPLKDAAAYIAKLSVSLPDDAYLDEHWTGYEDMEMRIVSYRLESDEEYAHRKELDALKAERARAEKAEAERDHALARLGVALTGARDRYAQAMLDYDYDESGPALAGLIRDLPLDPDAEAALDNLLAEARLEGWRVGREAAAHACDWGDIYGDNAVRAIRALPEPKETSDDPAL